MCRSARRRREGMVILNSHARGSCLRLVCGFLLPKVRWCYLIFTLAFSSSVPPREDPPAPARLFLWSPLDWGWERLERLPYACVSRPHRKRGRYWPLSAATGANSSLFISPSYGATFALRPWRLLLLRPREPSALHLPGKCLSREVFYIDFEVSRVSRVGHLS